MSLTGTRTLARVCLVAALLTASACRDDARLSASSAAPSSARSGAPAGASAPHAVAPAPTSAAPVPGAHDPAVEDELSTRPMELLRFRFTSGIDGREPKPEIDHAKPGQRVYGYLAIRNRTGTARSITLAWKVNGEARTTTELKVDESWQFRTWGYNTVLPKDTKGTLELEVTDDAGHVLVEKKLPIRP